MNTITENALKIKLAQKTRQNGSPQNRQNGSPQNRQKGTAPKPIKPALKPKTPKPNAPEVRKYRSLPPGVPMRSPNLVKPKMRVQFANAVGKPLTATKEIQRIGTKKFPAPRKTRDTLSLTTYRRMLAKRNKYKHRLAVLENEAVGKVRVPWCGFGKCEPARPLEIVRKNIREVKNSMSALNSSIARQKKLIVATR